MNANPIHKKPPLGIMPARLHKQHRVAEIARAIQDYAQDGRFIPAEWAEELTALTEWLRDHPEPLSPMADESDSGRGAVAGLGFPAQIVIEIRGGARSLVQGVVAHALEVCGHEVICGEKGDPRFDPPGTFRKLGKGSTNLADVIVKAAPMVINVITSPEPL